MILSGFPIFYAVLGYFAMFLLMGIIHKKLIARHPYLDLLEKGGILVRTLDSTGVIKTLVVNIQPPYVHKGREQLDVFDRDAVFHELLPRFVNGGITEIEDEDGKKYTVIIIPQEIEANARFLEEQHPVFLWNAQTKTFLTKQLLSAFEKEMLTNHLLLYLVEKVKELSNNIRDFARYVVEMTRPRKAIWQNWLFWIILVVGALLLAFLLSNGIGGLASEAVAPVAPNTPITPHG